MEREDVVNWFVVKTNSRAEKRVSERIQKIGIPVYLPLVESLKQWSDRKKKVQKPLISSTLFVKCYSSDLSKLYEIQGLHCILKHLNKPAVVHDYEIENLKILLKESDVLEPIDNVNFFSGEPVKVIRGPLQGLIATSVEDNRKNRLIVQIESLGKHFLVHINKSFVRKL